MTCLAFLLDALALYLFATLALALATSVRRLQLPLASWLHILALAGGALLFDPALEVFVFLEDLVPGLLSASQYRVSNTVKKNTSSACWNLRRFPRFLVQTPAFLVDGGPVDFHLVGVLDAQEEEAEVVFYALGCHHMKCRAGVEMWWLGVAVVR